MSYIDTFDHEFVAFFGGLPVYHPIEECEAGADDPRDFACHPGQLVIGGGSGEHFGIIVKDPANAVARFLMAWLDQIEDKHPYDKGEPPPFAQAWDESLRDEVYRPWSDLFEFAGWSVMDYAEFHGRCGSAAFARPYRRDADGLVESRLAASIGEFVFFSMPELGMRTIALLDDPHTVAKTPLYENFSLRPPGYPCWVRRTVGGATEWGASAWRIERYRHDGNH